MHMRPSRVTGCYCLHDILAHGRLFRDDMQMELIARKGLAAERANPREKRIHRGTSEWVGRQALFCFSSGCLRMVFLSNDAIMAINHLDAAKIKP